MRLIKGVFEQNRRGKIRWQGKTVIFSIPIVIHHSGLITQHQGIGRDRRFPQR